MSNPTIGLELKDISFDYEKNQVLSHLSWSIPKGTIMGLVGLNGSGKTTLLRGIAGRHGFDEGTMNFEGAILTRNKVSLLETEAYFYPRITGGEYLNLFQLTHRTFPIEGWNRLFELPLNDLIESYSNGMKKKLSLLGILSFQRPILLLDEPFQGVDLESNRKIGLILRALQKKGMTIIITSHIFEALTGICDRIAYLKSGKIQLELPRERFNELESIIFKEDEIQLRSQIEELLA